MKKTIRGRSVKKPQSSTVRKRIAISAREETAFFVDHFMTPEMWTRKGQELLQWFEDNPKATDLEEFLDAGGILYDTFLQRLETSPEYNSFYEAAKLKMSVRRRRLTNEGKYKETLYKDDQHYYSPVLREARKMLKEQRIDEHKHMEKNRNMEGQQSQHIPVFPVYLTDGEQIELEEFKAWKKAKAAGELT